MDFRQVDLNLLIALDVLLSEKSVTRAATRLHLSQPAASALLGKLRKIFCDPLLLRTAHGMLPTPRALQLVAPLKNLLSNVNQLIQPPVPFEPSKAQASFSISTTDYVELTLLPAIVNNVAKEAPSIRLILGQIDFEKIERQMAVGEIDICITTHARAPTLCAEELYSERSVWVIRRNHPMAQSRLTLDRLCNLDHVAVTSIVSEHTDRLLKASGRSRNIRLTVPHYFMLPEIVSKSDMIALLPLRLARRYKRTLLIRESPIHMPTFPVNLLWHERTQHEPGLIWLRNILTDTAKKTLVF